MKNKLSITFGEEQSLDNITGIADIKYSLWTAFDDEPVMIGNTTKEVYSLTGTILWDKALEYVLSILNTYKDNPKLGTGFIDEIALEIIFENYESTEAQLLIEFSRSRDMLGNNMQVLLKDIDFICKKFNFKGTINEIPLERFLNS